MECLTCEGNGKMDELCNTCNGSGEGMHDGSHCRICRGEGSKLVQCIECGGSGEVKPECCECDKKLTELEYRNNHDLCDECKKELKNEKRK